MTKQIPSDEIVKAIQKYSVCGSKLVDTKVTGHTPIKYNNRQVILKASECRHMIGKVNLPIKTSHLRNHPNDSAKTENEKRQAIAAQEAGME